jgi:hypothetical protein
MDFDCGGPHGIAPLSLLSVSQQANNQLRPWFVRLLLTLPYLEI